MVQSRVCVYVYAFIYFFGCDCIIIKLNVFSFLSFENIVIHLASPNCTIICYYCFAKEKYKTFTEVYTRFVCEAFILICWVGMMGYLKIKRTKLHHIFQV